MGTEHSSQCPLEIVYVMMRCLKSDKVFSPQIMQECVKNMTESPLTIWGKSAGFNMEWEIKQEGYAKKMEGAKMIEITAIEIVARLKIGSVCSRSSVKVNFAYSQKP